MPRTTYMVSWFDPEADRSFTSQFDNKTERDAYAEEARKIDPEASVWTQTWI